FHNPSSPNIHDLSLHDALPISTARLNTGKAPGKAISTSLAWVFGSAPKAALLLEKILDAVDSCTCVSKPMTISQSMITAPVFVEDRKSTRLNSSHVSISYAVFC